MAVKRSGKRLLLIVLTAISGAVFLCALLAGVAVRFSGNMNSHIPVFGWIFFLESSNFGFIIAMAIPFFVAMICLAMLIYMGWTKRRKEEKAILEAINKNSSEDYFPELDHKLKNTPGNTPTGVKTLVITQTRAASSAIRSQKGEVRISASGKEKVIPMNVGRRVVSIGGYTVTVDIEKEPERMTEDITKEIPIIKGSVSVPEQSVDSFEEKSHLDQLNNSENMKNGQKENI